MLLHHNNAVIVQLLVLISDIEQSLTFGSVLEALR